MILSLIKNEQISMTPGILIKTFIPDGIKVRSDTII
jgi:hypothetical protein